MFAAIMIYLARIRPAFSRAATFHWFALLIIGLALGNDSLGGISPAVRALGMGTITYDAFRHVLHSTALDLAKLSSCWCAALLNIFDDRIVRIDGRRTFIVDGFNNPKEGRRMPGVKKMHQESSSNSKPEIIRGHYFQVIGVLVEGVGTLFCLPFFGKIFDGFRLKADDKRTLKDKLAEALVAIPLLSNGLLLGDCWYACAPIINHLPASFNLAILSRVARNAVAYALPLPDFARPSRRGRKPKYGAKICLADLFTSTPLTKASIPDGHGGMVEVKFWHMDLLWRPLRKFVRFVGCEHPIKGKIILISTSITMAPLDMIIGYSRRFRIEVTFKTAVYSIRTFGYRMWSKSVDKLPRFPASEDLTQRSSEYVAAFMRKIAAYEAFVMAGFIAQGLLVMLSLHHTDLVQRALSTWFRTLRPGVSLSETVVAASLRTNVGELRDGSAGTSALAKFIAQVLCNSPDLQGNCTPRVQSA